MTLLRSAPAGPGRWRPFATGRSRGQAIVELALILPVLLLLLAAGADLARIFHSHRDRERGPGRRPRGGRQPDVVRQPGGACNATTNRVMCAVLTRVERIVLLDRAVRRRP